jgi:hypothetical protein
MTSSLSTQSPELPHWATPTPPPLQPMTIGIDPLANFYLYDRKDVIFPEIRGAITALRLIQLAGNTESGPRDYLEVRMISGAPTQPFRLLLPADERPVDREPGKVSTSNSIKSLLGALLVLDLTTQAVKLITSKGEGRVKNRKPTFINVCVCGPDWESIAQVRAENIGGSKADMVAAIAQINQSLQQGAVALPSR